LRSDRDHCASRVAVEQEEEERRRGEEERRRGDEEQATDIKSNNPHLAGGELSNGGKCRDLYYSLVGYTPTSEP
jgi:hypothetical protein